MTDATQTYPVVPRKGLPVEPAVAVLKVVAVGDVQGPGSGVGAVTGGAVRYGDTHGKFGEACT